MSVFNICLSCPSKTEVGCYKISRIEITVCPLPVKFKVLPIPGSPGSFSLATLGTSTFHGFWTSLDS